MYVLVGVQVLLLVKHSATNVTHVELGLCITFSFHTHGGVVVLLLFHSVELTVLLQVVFPPELMVADITLEHLLADVVPHVQIEAAVVDESLATVATLEGSLPCVYSLMNLCSLSIGKILPTSFTREGLHSTVHSLVLEQSATLGAAVVTHVTFVGLLPTVDPLVGVVVATG